MDANRPDFLAFQATRVCMTEEARQKRQQRGRLESRHLTGTGSLAPPPPLPSAAGSGTCTTHTPRNTRTHANTHRVSDDTLDVHCQVDGEVKPRSRYTKQLKQLTKWHGVCQEGAPIRSFRRPAPVRAIGAGALSQLGHRTYLTGAVLHDDRHLLEARRASALQRQVEAVSQLAQHPRRHGAQRRRQNHRERRLHEVEPNVPLRAAAAAAAAAEQPRRDAVRVMHTQRRTCQTPSDSTPASACVSRHTACWRRLCRTRPPPKRTIPVPGS